ncbi:MAG: nuclear transport factor 2 family protein [Cyclobacteriaceae bacterium]
MTLKDMMKRSLFLLVIATVISCVKNDSGASRSTLEQALQEFNAAFEQANVEVLDQMISKNYVHTNGSWKSFGREDWLGYMKKRKVEITTGELQVTKYEMREVEIEMHGSSAIITGKFLYEGVQKGISFEREIRVTNLWVIENEKWKRAGFHDTRIKNPAP